MNRWLALCSVLALMGTGATITGCDNDCDDNSANCKAGPLPDSGYFGDAGTCDVVAQNCPMGLKCTLMPVSTGTDAGTVYEPRCKPAGTVMEGQACTVDSKTFVDNCAAGTFCVCSKVDPKTGACTGSNLCAKFCAAGMDSQCTLMPQNGLCDLGIRGSLPQATVCEYPPLCDPLKQDCSDSSTSCYWNTSKKLGFCFATGSTASGSSCTFANDCVRGDLCEGSGTTGTCSQICAINSDAGGGPTCTAPATCMSLGTDPVGYCK